MPVSTFSHGSAELRASSRSEIVSRWNSTRERLLLDERRVRDCQIQEMDGTGLYERSDWPMRPPSASPPGESENDKGFETGAAWEEGDHHITDVAAVGVPDGQWAVDVDSNGEQAERLGRRSSKNVVMPERGRAVLLPVNEEEELHWEPGNVLKGQDSATSIPPPDVKQTLEPKSRSQQSMREDRVSLEVVPNGTQDLSDSNDRSVSPMEPVHANGSTSSGSRTIIARSSTPEETSATPDERARTRL